MTGKDAMREAARLGYNKVKISPAPNNKAWLCFTKTEQAGHSYQSRIDRAELAPAITKQLNEGREIIVHFEFTSGLKVCFTL